MFSITRQIKLLRLKEGLTQYDFSKIMNTTQSTIARWETPGYSGYSLSKLFKMADQLRYDIKIMIVKRSIGTNTNTAADFVKQINTRMINGSFSQCVKIENKGVKYDTSCVVSNIQG